MSKIFSHASSAPAAAPGTQTQSAPAAAQQSQAPAAPATAVAPPVVDVARHSQRFGEEKSGEIGLAEVDCGFDEACRHGQQLYRALAAGGRVALQRRSK